MSGNEFHGKKSENQDEDYEKTVLNFLNREIAQTQSEQEPAKNQSSEVDSIVSDLLKQVITESDLQQTDQQLHSENLDSLLSEFPDAKKDEPLLNKKPDPAPLPAPVPKVPAEIFRSTVAQSTGKKMPVKAIALVFALGIVIAATVYFFAGHRSSPTKNASAPVSVSNPTPQNQVVQSTQANEAGRQALLPNPASAVMPERLSSAKLEAKEPARNESTQNIAANAVSTPAKKESALNPPDTQAAQAASTALKFAPAPVSSDTIVISALENASSVKPPVAPPPLVAEPPAAAAKPTPADPPVVSREVIPATLLSQVTPNYPAIALRTRASATVVLDLQIDNTGKVIKATPVSGPDIFYSEAVKAAMKWRYKPASINGTNVPSNSSVKMQFKFN
jgi:TonB family protein